MSKIIAVDFDSTLCSSLYPDATYQNWLNKLILAYVKHRQKKGDTIVLWTCRTNGSSNGDTWAHDNSLTLAVNYLKALGFIPNRINEGESEVEAQYGGPSRKVYADRYIDDKNAGFFGWLLRFTGKISYWKLSRIEKTNKFGFTWKFATWLALGIWPKRHK